MKKKTMPTGDARRKRLAYLVVHDDDKPTGDLSPKWSMKTKGRKASLSVFNHSVENAACYSLKYKGVQKVFRKAKSHVRSKAKRNRLAIAMGDGSRVAFNSAPSVPLEKLFIVEIGFNGWTFTSHFTDDNTERAKAKVEKAFLAWIKGKLSERSGNNPFATCKFVFTWRQYWQGKGSERQSIWTIGRVDDTSRTLRPYEMPTTN